MKTLFYTLLFFSLIAYSSDKPNIILFLVDDMGLMDTSQPFLTNGKGETLKHPLNSYYKTPGMERLANTGLVMSQFYANSVCSPTRATLMTGQASARHHITQFIKPESKNSGTFGPEKWKWEGLNNKDTTLPAILSEGGYRTIHCGKAHFAPIGHEGEDPKKIGFDINIAGCAFGAPGSYLGSEHFGLKNPKRKKRAVPGLEQYHGKDIFLTEALTLEVKKAISKSVEDKKPFFAYMSHYAVHSPFESDSRFNKNYKDSGKAKSAQNYATLIEGMDKSLNDILNHLNTLNISENTLVIFIGDNGSDAPLGKTHSIASSAPLRGKKGTHYEGGMRVPFIASWAKPAKNPLQKSFQIKNLVIDQVFAKVSDIFPTILDAAGIQKPKNHITDGTSLRHLLSGNTTTHPQKFLMHFPHSHRSSYFTVLREGDYKLIFHYKKKGLERYELFDLINDPYEEKNLANTKPEILKKMIGQMNLELENCNAQYPHTGDKSSSIKPN